MTPSKWCSCNPPAPKHDTDTVDICRKCGGLTAVKLSTLAELERVREFVRKIETNKDETE